MKPNDLQLVSLECLTPPSFSVVEGRLIGTTLKGEPVVDYPGNIAGPLIATILASAIPSDDASEGTPTAVALAFEAGDPTRPVILGFLLRRLPRAGANAGAIDVARTLPGCDEKTVDISATQRMTFRCGKSSIALYADGRIVLKGTRLVSRASETNKIKGATVSVN